MKEIRCFECGECCKASSLERKLSLSITREEILLIQRKTGVFLSGVEVRPNRFTVAMGEVCPFLRDNRCNIYEIRPCQCRLYHCGRIKPDDERLDSLADVRKLMIENSDYYKFKTEMDNEAIEWGNAHGWNWKKKEEEKIVGDKVVLQRL